MAEWVQTGNLKGPRGKSAYEVAVEHGYQGTEEQWLESIDGSGASRVRFVQTVPAATWTIVHNLGAYPVLNLFLSTDPTEPVFTDVTYPDGNTIVVEWPTPVAGRAES